MARLPIVAGGTKISKRDKESKLIREASFLDSLCSVSVKAWVLNIWYVKEVLRSIMRACGRTIRERVSASW
jgi:hypothetical protein